VTVVHCYVDLTGNFHCDFWLSFLIRWGLAKSSFTVKKLPGTVKTK